MVQFNASYYYQVIFTSPFAISKNMFFASWSNSTPVGKASLVLLITSKVNLQFSSSLNIAVFVAVKKQYGKYKRCVAHSQTNGPLQPNHPLNHFIYIQSFMTSHTTHGWMDTGQRRAFSLFPRHHLTLLVGEGRKTGTVRFDSLRHSLLLNILECDPGVMRYRLHHGVVRYITEVG